MGEENIPVWLDFVKTVGFPVAVAAWFMLRTEKKLDQLAAALTDLTRAIQRKGGI